VLREAIILGYHVFDHLAVRDLKTRRVVPHLATSWKALDDTTWEVKLRQGVKFHDGTPFTARDVKATFDRVLDPAKKMTARGNHAKIKSVEVVDDSTVRFKTDGPYPLFVERLTAQVMQSDKVIREKGHDFMQENPIGTGPYKLVKWNRKQDHMLVRNDDYWGPKPAFKYVRVRIIPEKATEIAELLSGGVDIIKAVPPDQMDVIAKSGQARTSTSPILRTAMLQLDQAARSGPTPSPTAACGRPRTWPPTTTRSSSSCSTASATAWPPASTPWPSAGTRSSSPTSRTWRRPRSCWPTPATRTASTSSFTRGRPSWSRPSSRPTTRSSPTWPRSASA
jgi:hypothetical protein